jgi:3-dehydroquinate synthase
MDSLRVALPADSAERSYPIHIGPGIIDDPTLYAEHVSTAAAVVTNRIVAPLYLSRVQTALQVATARVEPVIVEDGEQAKRWEVLEQLFDALLAARLGRDAVIVALGGGVVGDLAGFAAAVYQRGIRFIQVPTTLLAQVDSSVGGKTAINHARGKNMIGAFHQPRAVIADVATLDTLPDRELRAGLAEVIKHGAALDLAFLEWLEKHMDALLAREQPALVYAVRRSCELKAAIVAEDERESGARALLNFGHTFGHAIETATGYGAWLHGEAVAAGMVMAARLSARAGLLGAGESARLQQLITRAGLPTMPPRMEPGRWLDLMALDKKSAQGRMRFVLLEALGKATLRSGVDERLVREVVAEMPAAAQ